MNIKSISKRTLAYMILKVSATLGGGFVVGVEVWQAAAVAAFVGFMEVAEEVSRAYVYDGDVSESDMDEIFGSFSEDEDPELGK
jgi:hypothetical protein|tara:strand:- start:201 stop:452 length:252 start_codon:yes stop_codon:yes gene_type:complete